MSWYKVTMPLSECGLSGRGKELQDAFEKSFMAYKAPRDAAMFSQRDDAFENNHYYFSPGAAKLICPLIERMGGVQCAPPQNKEMPSLLILLVGHADARESLLRSAGNS